MKEDRYDDPALFAKYSQMPRSRHGLEAAGEWETLRTLLPGFAGLWEFWKICVEIGRDNSFSQKNARSLFRICLLALMMAALLAVGVAALCLLGMGLPALLIAMLGFAAACALVALLANALAQLVRRAAAIKSENDLTI